MAEVSLHVYDVTNSMNGKANNAIMTLNRVMRDGIGVGGIFHGAIQVYEEEWSFGFCESGSGVFSCPPKGNPMYTFRETVPLGNTTCSRSIVNQILTEMSGEWQGNTYDLLARNCNHFCEVFVARLGVEKLPLWVNRFAKTGDAAVEVAGFTIDKFNQAKAGATTAGRNAYRYLFGPPASGAGSEAASPSVSRSGSNNSSSSRRFNFARTPSREMGRTSFDYQGEEPLVNEKPSKVEIEKSFSSLFNWKQPSLAQVEDSNVSSSPKV